MLLKVQKIGENLIVQIPRDFAQCCGLENGGKVNVRLSNDSIVIEAIDHSTTAAAREHGECRKCSEMYLG